MKLMMCCGIIHIFRVICAFLLFNVAYCSYDCVKQYNDVNSVVLPRQYRYYHETLSPNPGNINENEVVEISFRIVGGSQISIQEAPYQVLYGRYCGGSIIAPEWVITAAHCGDARDFVYAGSKSSSKMRSYPICAHYIHPLWQKTGLHSYDYDFQLVLLEKPIPVTPYSRPIAIGNLEDIQDGATVSVSGWGYKEHKQHYMEENLRRVWVPVMNMSLCRSLPSHSYQTVTDRMFCAGLLGGAKDACQGDSGGPAVINGKLVGLVSFGIGCAEKEHPGVYSNIPLVREWIRAVTRLLL